MRSNLHLVPVTTELLEYNKHGKLMKTPIEIKVKRQENKGKNYPYRSVKRGGLATNLIGSGT